MITNMMSNTADTFPDGAYCPLGQYNRKADIEGGLTIVLYETHHGLCLSKRERNMYDDSDFYMTVWNPEKGKPEEICFASTRSWSYPCMASSVDATPEVRVMYEAWIAAEKARYRVASRKAKATKLREVRAVMLKVSAQYGVPYNRLLKLRSTRTGTWLKVMYLLTARVRSGFKVSLRNQAVVWLKDPAPKYTSPFSSKQTPYIEEYKI